MSHTLHDDVDEVIHDVLEGLSEEDMISHSAHKKLEHAVLLFRNISVALAVVLFIASLIHLPHSSLLKGIAYFLGAAAYLAEFLLLTDCFSKRVPHQEIFMAYCFGPMYILLGLSYLFGGH